MWEQWVLIRRTLEWSRWRDLTDDEVNLRLRVESWRVIKNQDLAAVLSDQTEGTYLMIMYIKKEV